jgi:hypothetical protein
MKSDHSVSPTNVFSFDENGVVILSDLDIFYDDRPATTSGSGSIVPQYTDHTEFLSKYGQHVQ